MIKNVPNYINISYNLAKLLALCIKCGCICIADLFGYNNNNCDFADAKSIFMKLFNSVLYGVQASLALFNSNFPIILLFKI